MGLRDFINDYGTIIGAAGKLASSESAVKKLEGLGADAVDTIGFPTDQGIYNTVKSDTQFKPFSVTGLPTGNVNVDAMGGAQYNLSPQQAALQNSLQTGGSQLIDAILGRGQFGTLNPETGQMEQNMRAGQADLINMLEMNDLDAQGRSYRGLQQENYLNQYADPFSAANLAGAEQTAYDRLRAIRTPEEQRAQTGLNQNLVAQGRQGLQTAQFGGSPEQFALSKAIEEQKSADALSAMGIARQDAEALANQRRLAVGDARTDQALGSSQRLQALQQQVAEKGLGADIASSFLTNSYLPQNQLLQTLAPSTQLANISTAAGRSLGNYGMNLGNAMLNYDLGARGTAANLRNQTIQGLFGLLTADKTSQQNSGSNNLLDNLAQIQQISAQGNPDYDPNNPSTWYGGQAPNFYP